MSTASDDRIRLHITPFNPDLLERYIPTSLKSQATNISFHTVETYPERGFGYVELPSMEAVKLKKKLNGSTLKGSKVKIEEAKPEKKRKKAVEEEEPEADDQKARKKAKKEKRKKEDGVIEGYELEEGRRVKRGWVEDKTKAKKSKSLDGQKLRFKTSVPPNKVDIEEKEAKAEKKDKKDKKDKKEKKSKKEVVVKEFDKTTKPIDKVVAAKKATTYEDGVGWIDGDGNVVEEEPPQKKRKRSKAVAVERIQTPEPVVEPEAAQESSSEAEDPDSDSGDEEATPSKAKSSMSKPSKEEPESEADTEISEDESQGDDQDDEVDRQLKAAQNNLHSNAAVEREQSNSIPIADAVPSAEQDAKKEVHPLEALFKRSAAKSEDAERPKPAPIDTSFSFFNSGADDDEPMVEDTIPQTPHTKQDLEWRSMRSAAPTPDTAAIGKRFSFPFASQDIDEEPAEDVEMEDAGEDQARPGAQKGENGEKVESEFRKWFYDNRGDLNRSWKQRRREEKKVVRQRENKRLSRRIA